MPARKIVLDPQISYDGPIPPSRDPVQELRQRVDLVVMPTARELCDFDKEIIEPIGAFRHMHMAGFDFRGLSVHPAHLVPLRFNRDRLREARKIITTQVLDQRCARTLIFNQWRPGAPLAPALVYPPPEDWVDQFFSLDLKNEIIVAPDQESHTYRKVGRQSSTISDLVLSMNASTCARSC